MYSDQFNEPLLFLNNLKELIRHRKSKGNTKTSYTSRLFEEGINKIAQKVGEEAIELIIEAKDHDDERFKNEAADLLFHLLVLLEAKNVDLDEVIHILEERYKRKIQ